MWQELITYIVLPLTVAYIATVMSKRKEIQLEAQSQLLEHRIQTYVEVYRLIRQNLKRIAVPFAEEKFYMDCLEGANYKIGRQGMEYVSYLSSIENIEQYLNRLDTLILNNGLYLEPKLRRELYDFQTWIIHFHHLIKAFEATEEDSHWNFDAILRRNKVRYACSLMGIALQEDINQFSSNIEHILEDRLRHPKIRKWRFKASNLDSSRSVTQTQLATHMADLIVRLNYLHYSDRFTPNGFDALPDDERQYRLLAFFTIMNKNLT